MPAEAIILIISALIKEGIPAARAIVQLFYKETVTLADWEEVFKACETKSYDDYVKPTPVPPAQ